ncbi:MAG: methyltransferase, partial [Gemmatimonadaceae bacterium]|nr:methyltransferase [Gemmatimonadaceae bacterium]
LEGDEFDVVVTNPPFHHGKATTLDVPRAFIADAHALLARGGWLQLVANRTLPYEAMLREHFGDHAVVIESPRFKVLAARKR